MTILVTRPGLGLFDAEFLDAIAQLTKGESEQLGRSSFVVTRFFERFEFVYPAELALEIVKKGHSNYIILGLYSLVCVVYSSNSQSERSMSLKKSKSKLY